jgi:hypothetical protein
MKRNSTKNENKKIINNKKAYQHLLLLLSSMSVFLGDVITLAGLGGYRHTHIESRMTTTHGQRTTNGITLSFLVPAIL